MSDADHIPYRVRWDLQTGINYLLAAQSLLREQGPEGQELAASLDLDVECLRAKFILYCERHDLIH